MLSPSEPPTGSWTCSYMPPQVSRAQPQPPATKACGLAPRRMPRPARWPVDSTGCEARAQLESWARYNVDDGPSPGSPHATRRDGTPVRRVERLSKRRPRFLFGHWLSYLVFGVSPPLARLRRSRAAVLSGLLAH